jgi:uncharacterized repeat protein (TIGR03803 family)
MYRMKTHWLLIIIVLNFTAWAATQETVLHNFGERQDGGNPASGLTLKNNRLYGTTQAGGAYANGTVYEMRRSGGNWLEVVIHDFNGTDGSAPQGNVIFDNSGNMYGTTFIGGAYGQGTVFKMSPTGDTWTETVLYSFSGGADGAIPSPQLEFDDRGNLYGTTRQFGAYGGGTVFKLSFANGAWTESTLYSFSNKTGARPFAGVIYREGALYGTTFAGGARGLGTIFKLRRSASTWSYQTLHNFSGQEGSQPVARVFFSKGILYGTTTEGGTHYCGTVFALSLSSKLLRSFSFDRIPNGCNPFSGVILDAENNLYGTTYSGGANNRGVVFKLRPTTNGWTETPLYTFGGGNDGGSPVCDILVFSADKTIYGTTPFYGSQGVGVVFELVPQSSEP